MLDSIERMLDLLPESFVRDRSSRRQARVQQVIGAVFLGAGGATALLAAGLREAWPLLIGFGLAIPGVPNFAVGTAMLRRAEDNADVEPSEDARTLILSLVAGRESSQPVVGPRRGHGRFRGTLMRTCPTVIVPAPLEKLLEEFAEAYLDLRGSGSNDSSHGLRVRVASDEAAAEIFTLVAKAIRHPGEGHEDGIRKLIAGTREAAARLVSRSSGSGALDSLLVDLREEEQARQELSG